MFKRKTTQEIEERAKIQERKVYEKKLLDQNERAESFRQEGEKLFHQKLRDQSNMHDTAIKKMSEDMAIEFNRRVEKIIKDKDEIIHKIKNELSAKDDIIKDNQKAWFNITHIMPRILNLTSMFSIDAKTKQLQASETSQYFSKHHDECESIIRTINKISPDMNKLLHMGEE